MAAEGGARRRRMTAVWAIMLVVTPLTALGPTLLTGRGHPGDAAALLAFGSNDRGSERLRAGSYLGWGDGEAGRLLLSGEGCREAATGDSLVSLVLTGPSGTVRLGAESVSELVADLGHGEPHALLAVELPATDSQTFDRAVLRCRSGAEATARISLRFERVAGAAPRAGSVTLLGTSNAPGVGSIELTLLNGPEPVRLTNLDYAPADVATGLVRAAAGERESLPLWRGLIHGPGGQRLDPSLVTPWDVAYQSPSDPRYLGERPAGTLDLALGPHEAAILVLDRRSFRPGPEVRPLLLFPLVRYESAAGPGVLAVQEVAFGWSSRVR